MHGCASSVMNLDLIAVIALRAEGDLQRESENLKNTASVTQQILQQSPFSTAC